MKEVKLMLGDNMESLKLLEDNSIDSIVTDPPYGLSFMGKKWDYDVPSVELWKEVYRVLKPGGHLLSFGGTRTYHRMVVNIEDAGFEIRDQIQWLYGSGFPKSHNIGKQEGCEEFIGFGTALKPANEPICVARKPLSEKTIADNVLKWGTGGINVDGCRVGSEVLTHSGCGKSNIGAIGGSFDKGTKGDMEFTSEGRFPANIIFDESAAQMLNEQSGMSKSSKGKQRSVKNIGSFGGGLTNDNNEYNDKGGASRFFYVAKVSKSERNMGLDHFEDKVTPVNTGINSTNENGEKVRNDGSVIPPLVAKNTHPTLKPVQLMAYLVRLVTPPNGIVLDPFMGSGSTGISACLEGFRFCGMEMEEEYFKIASARIENYEMYRKFLKENKKKC